MVDKIPENQLNAINQAKADGISAEERKKLEMQGVADELLEKLSGTKSADEVDKAIEAYLNEQQESPSFWKNPLKWFKSDKVSTGEKILAGAGIALVAGLGGWGAVAALGAKGAALTLTALGVFTACTNDMDQEVTLNVEKENYDALLKALQDKEKADQARHEEMMKYLKALGKGMDEVVKMLLVMGAKLDEVIELMIVNGTTTDQIVKILKEQGKDIKAIYAALGDMNIEQEKQTELLKTLVGNDKIEVKYLEEILTEVKKGNELQAKENEILNLILDKLQTLDANDAKGAELLNAILAQLSAFVKQEGDMDEKTHSLLHTIISNQNKMSEEAKENVAKILAKLDKMDDSMKKGFTNVINHIVKGNNIDAQILAKLTQVLEKLDNMSKTDKAAYTAILNAIQNIDVGDNSELSAQLEAILDAINNGNSVTAAQLEELRKLIAENNKIAKGTQDAVNKLNTQMAEDHKAILAKLKDGNASLDEIKKLLQGIQTGVDNNTVQLTEINDKLSLAGAVINNILANVAGLKDETKALLLQILAKIPNGCTCTTVDLSVLLDKLDKILDALKKDCADGKEDENHEGILKDLEDYFG